MVNISENAGRWPPVYDFESLLKTIAEQIKNGELLARFYSPDVSDPSFFQGDIVELQCPIPLINEKGIPAKGQDFRFWLVIGNTCDFDRSCEDVPFTQLVPIIQYEPTNQLSSKEIRALQSYEAFRGFYLPPWTQDLASSHFMADLTRPVTADKLALSGISKLNARLNFASWGLLNSCLIRFLARDDGRHE